MTCSLPQGVLCPRPPPSAAQTAWTQPGPELLQSLLVILLLYFLVSECWVLLQHIPDILVNRENARDEVLHEIRHSIHLLCGLLQNFFLEVIIQIVRHLQTVIQGLVQVGIKRFREVGPVVLYSVQDGVILYHLVPVVKEGWSCTAGRQEQEEY